VVLLCFFVRWARLKNTAPNNKPDNYKELKMQNTNVTTQLNTGILPIKKSM